MRQLCSGHQEYHIPGLFEWLACLDSEERTRPSPSTAMYEMRDLVEFMVD